MIGTILVLRLPQRLGHLEVPQRASLVSMVSMRKMPAEHADTAVMSRGNARMIGESRAARDVGVRHGRTDLSEAPSSTMKDIFAASLTLLLHSGPRERWCEYLRNSTLEIETLHWIFSRHHVDHKTVPVTHGKLCGAPKTLQSRSQSTSPRTRYEVAHGNVRHAHERPRRELPLDRGIDYDQFQLP